MDDCLHTRTAVSFSGTRNQRPSYVQACPKERMRLLASGWEFPRIWISDLSVHMRRVIAALPLSFAGFVPHGYSGR